MSDPEKWLLITGSRQCGPNLLLLADQAVVWARRKGWGVIVGDAEGVDARVIEACEREGVVCEVHGAYGR